MSLGIDCLLTDDADEAYRPASELDRPIASVDRLKTR